MVMQCLIELSDKKRSIVNKSGIDLHQRCTKRQFSEEIIEILDPANTYQEFVFADNFKNIF